MTRSIKDWCRDAHALAVKKGWHLCSYCGGHGVGYPAVASNPCPVCKGSGDADPRGPTRIGSRLALIHGEISEALECVARGRMELYWVCGQSTRKHPKPLAASTCSCGVPAKPEGLPIELADVFLRLCDFAESLQIRLPENVMGLKVAPIDLNDPEVLAGRLNEMHNDLAADTLTAGCKALLVDLAELCSGLDIDLLAMAELKHAFNCTRPSRHGGKAL